MNRLKSGFSKFRDRSLVQKADAITTALCGNTHFADLQPLLPPLSSALEEFRRALAMAPGQAADAVIAASRAKLTTLLYNLAHSIELTPNLTDEMLATTGFEIRRPSVRTAAPVEAPQNVRLRTTGTSGQLQLLCNAVKRARAYQLQFTEDPIGSQWNDGGVFASTRGILLNDLTRGKDYWVRIRAIGPDGPGPWSDPATAMAT